jgi:hypothetical protein
VVFLKYGREAAWGAGTGMSARRPRPVFLVCLQAQKGVEPYRALRGALKTLKRRYGLRCVTAKEARRRSTR